jgi:ribosome biogenesis protein YTM1
MVDRSSKLHWNNETARTAPHNHETSACFCSLVRQLSRRRHITSITMADDDSSSDDNSSVQGEQVRVAFTLAPDCLDRSLEVPSHPISVPATIAHKGLNVLLNHLLERTSESDDEDALPTIKFEFILGKKNNKLLRTGVEREARRSGLSLEDAVPIVYFPAAKEPRLQDESEPLPDWIASMVVCADQLITVSYDGSVHVFDAKPSGLDCVGQLDKLHSGAIKCVAAAAKGDCSWIATGCMDHTLVLARLSLENKKSSLQQYATCVGGHASSIGSIDMFPSLSLASGDWDGGICVWDCSQTPEYLTENQPSSKKIKTSEASVDKSSSSDGAGSLAPKISIQAHTSKVSGISWGNFEKQRDSTASQLITGSWDHSIKVWDVESQDCVLTLNGSRVVSCLDTSHHSSGIVATGHPDCTVRLWDVRSVDSKQSNLTISDNTFKPSHKEWITSVKWSPDVAYHLASTSHDGTVKFWDIRSSLPLYTVRAFPKEQKGLCLTYGKAGTIFAGGTDCVVKEFKPSLVRMQE